MPWVNSGLIAPSLNVYNDPGRCERSALAGWVSCGHRSVPLVVDVRVAVIVGVPFSFKPAGGIVFLFNCFSMEYNRLCPKRRVRLVLGLPARAETRTGNPGRRSAVAPRAWPPERAWPVRVRLGARARGAASKIVAAGGASVRSWLRRSVLRQSSGPPLAHH